MVENDKNASNVPDKDSSLSSSWRGQTLQNDATIGPRRTKQSEEKEFHKDMAKFINDHHYKVESLKT